MGLARGQVREPRVAARRARLGPTFAGATSVVLTVFMVLIVIAMLASMPLENIGFQRFFVLPLFAIGAAFSGVEWWTVGRHRLSPLIVGLAIVIALQGLVMSRMGAIEMYFGLTGGLAEQAMTTEELASAYLRGSQIIAEGEVVCFQLAAVLIVLWSVARYRIGRAD